VRWLSLCVAVLVLAGLAGSVDSARACSCAPPDPWTFLQRSDGAFVGRLVERRDADNSQVVLTFSVERAIKGAIGGTVEVRTNSSGASCGVEVPVGERIGLFLEREAGSWFGYLCGTVEPEDLLGAATPLPAPNGRGAPAMYVGGRFGAARIIALDARGRTLAYATGPGTTRLISVCPGGKRIAEVAYQYPSAVLAIRDARTLRLVRRWTVDLPQRRYPEGLLCENASGSTVVVFGIRADAPRGAALYRATGERVTAIWRGRGYLSSLNRGVAYLNAGMEGSRLVGLDLRTGRVLRLGSLPLSPKLVPDATGRRLAGVAYRIQKRSRLVLVQLGKATAVRWIPLADAEVNGDVHWLSDGRLLFVPFYDNDSARVLDLSLRTRAQFRFAARYSARVGSRVFGVESEGRVVSAELPDGPARVVRQLPGGARPQVLVSAG
jgi:hypothetical protein